MLIFTAVSSTQCLAFQKVLYTPIFAISVSPAGPHTGSKSLSTKERSSVRLINMSVIIVRTLPLKEEPQERLPTVFQITKKLCKKDICPYRSGIGPGVLLLPSDLSKNPRSVLLMVINKTLRYTRIFVPLVSRFASLIFCCQRNLFVRDT